MTLSENNQMAIRVLADAVIFQRISYSLQRAASALNLANGEEFIPERGYKGVNNALEMIGVTDPHLKDELFSIFASTTYDEWDVDHDELANKIFMDWILQIKEHYTSKKSA